MHIPPGLLSTGLALLQLLSIVALIYSTTRMRQAFKVEIAMRDAMLAALQHVVGRQARTLIEAGLHPFGEAEFSRHLDS